MRASNLQDLVYKNGQAGITKASVSITFDNSDKKQSPLGFEAHDEITVTRQVSSGQAFGYCILCDTIVSPDRGTTADQSVRTTKVELDGDW